MGLLPPEVVNNYRELFVTARRLFWRVDFNKGALIGINAAVIVYIIVFSSYSLVLHDVFYTQAFDAGIDDQGIWLLSRFQVPFVTVRGLNLFGDSITLYHLLIAPLMWIWDGIEVLFVIQTVFMAAAALPLFFYAVRRLDNPLAATAVVLSFLLYPALQNMNLDQYHSETLAVFFLTATLTAMMAKRWTCFYPLLVLSMAAKEDVALTVVAMGVYLYFFQREKRHGCRVVVMGVVWLIVCTRLLLPYFNDVGILSRQPLTYSHWHRGLLENLFNPLFYIRQVFHSESIRYYWGLFANLIFLPLLKPSLLIVLIPSMAVNVLSGSPYLRSVEYHYNYVTIPVLFVGFVEGLAFLKGHLSSRRSLKKATLFTMTLVVLAAAVAGNMAYSHLPLHGAWGMFTEKWRFRGKEEVRGRHEALRLIPREAKVSASYSLVPHLSHRREIYMFPNPFRPALWGQWFQEGKGLPPAAGHVDYLAIELSNHGEEEQAILRYLTASSHFTKIHEDGSFLILKRVNGQGNLAAGVNYVIRTRGGASGQDGEEVAGRVGSLYFPMSNYYLRTLMGEDITPPRPFRMELWGFLFVPADDIYTFSAGSSGRVTLTIADVPVTGAISLTAGFHPFRIFYEVKEGPYGLPFMVRPRQGEAYILPDIHIAPVASSEHFRSVMAAYGGSVAASGTSLGVRENLAANGDFEEVRGKDPQVWRMECWQAPGVNCRYGTAEREAVSGRRSAFIVHDGPADCRWVQDVLLKPRTRYRLSGWIRVKDVPRDGPGAYLQVEGTPLKTVSVKGTTGWRYVETMIKTGGQPVVGKLLCRLGDYGAPTQGTALFDGVVLHEGE